MNICTKKISNFLIASSALLGLLVGACEKPAIDDENSVTIADTPFSSVSVVAEGETAEGVVTGTSVTFTFIKNVDVTAAKLNIEVNEGWTLTYPTDVNAYDMTASDKNLYFQDANGKKVTYAVTVSFDTNPIADQSLVKAGEYSVSVNAATNEIVIAWESSMDFNYDTKTDPRSNIALTFGAGALKDGAEYKGEASYDLTGGPAEFVVSYKGTDYTFTLKIDYTARMESYRDWGFTDISADYVPENYKSAITVYSATTLLKDVPPAHTGSESQSWWDNSGVEDQYHKMALLADYDLNIMSDATFTKIGETELSVVLIDPEVLSGSIVSNDKMSIEPSAANAVVAITGTNDQDKVIMMSGGKAVSTEIWYASPGVWRTCFMFDNSGKISFAPTAVKDDQICSIPFFEFEGGREDRLADVNLKPRADYVNYIGAPVTGIESLVSAKPLFVMSGRKLSFKEVIINDGMTESLGDGILGDRKGSFIGTTYDGKVGIAAMPGGNVGAVQMAYALYKLGWDNIMYLGGASWQSDSFSPAIYVDGKRVSSSESTNEKSKYVVAFNPVSK